MDQQNTGGENARESGERDEGAQLGAGEDVLGTEGVTVRRPGGERDRALGSGLKPIATAIETTIIPGLPPTGGRHQLVELAGALQATRRPAPVQEQTTGHQCAHDAYWRCQDRCKRASEIPSLSGHALPDPQIDAL